jgi:hypothetical protein
MAEQNTHRVLRPFHAERLRNAGDLVDATDWKNVKALEDQRYIERVDTENPSLGGPGPTPDPKLIQEAAARKGRSKNARSGGIAAMTEVEETLGEGEHGNLKAGGDTDDESDDGSQKPVNTALRGKLPEDFPGHAPLDAAGITTYGGVRKQMKGEGLTAVPNIGDATAAKIEEAMAGEAAEAGEADEAAGESTE